MLSSLAQLNTLGTLDLTCTGISAQVMGTNKGICRDMCFRLIPNPHVQDPRHIVCVMGYRYMPLLALGVFPPVSGIAFLVPTLKLRL